MTVKLSPWSPELKFIDGGNIARMRAVELGSFDDDAVR
jgi:hypothetical protein